MTGFADLTRRDAVFLLCVAAVLIPMFTVAIRTRPNKRLAPRNDRRRSS